MLRSPSRQEERRNEGVSPQPENNLPLQLTGLVGREREISEVGRLLGEARLLTLTGPGGSGKTRLALAVAFEVVEKYEDGVWLVELASLSDSELVPEAVASVLGVREATGTPLLGTLAEHLRSRSMLLVLDNCEHLIEASASLAEALLRRCPDLSILATSREALGITGESIFAVPPLSLPDPRRLPDPEMLARYEATRLFFERARAVKHDFSLTGGNAVAVAQVCYRLDGIPLAIELAAARARVLSVEQISARLDDSFGLLSGGGRRSALAHQRTLRAAMDWSHDLLSSEERILLRRLSVFAGGFVLEAAEAVGTGEGIEEAGVLDLMGSLVDKSLVLTMEQDEEARYRLLETVRQYASEKLEETGEADGVRRRHARYYLALAEEAERGSSGPDQARWLERLEAEHDNLRAALGWSLGGGGAEVGLGLAAALWSFWYTHGHLSEGRRWLESAVLENDPLRTRAKARALGGAGYIALFQGEYEAAKALLEEGLLLYRELEEKEGIASSLIYLGFVAVLGERDLETVPALYEEAVGLGPEIEDRRVVANLLLFQGLITIGQGDYERAAELHEEALVLFREIRDVQGMGHCLNNLALVAVIQGEYDEASTLIRENLLIATGSDYKLIIYYSLLGLGLVAASREQPARAARLWGAVEAMEEVFGIRITPLARSATNYESHLAASRSRLGEAAWEATWVEGRAMTPEQAVEYALEPPQEAPQPESPPIYPSGLSTREVEVLRLVARGMTNAQIAQELFISPRTVNGHLRSVYHKIGSSTRAEATRFALEHGLL
jgi:predicted ATPase/DNA-binding CsgD family transcriptional regulator